VAPYHPYCQLLEAMRMAREGLRTDMDTLLSTDTPYCSSRPAGEAASEHRQSSFMRCSFHAPDGEGDDDIESYLERNLHSAYIQVKVRFHSCDPKGEMKKKGHVFLEGLIHYCRLTDQLAGNDISQLPGICCECCHQYSCMGACGLIPFHGTGNQFFTPKLFRAYHTLGRAAAASTSAGVSVSASIEGGPALQGESAAQALLRCSKQVRVDTTRCGGRHRVL